MYAKRGGEEGEQRSRRMLTIKCLVMPGEKVETVIKFIMESLGEGGNSRRK